MNGMLLQLIASGAALSLMGGAVTVHYVHVREVSTAYGSEGGDDGYELASFESGGGRLARHSVEIESQPSRVSKASAPKPSKDEMTLEALQGIVNQIEALSRENKELKEEQSLLEEQLAEANRDLSQLQFRVDTHSESFRPLRVSEDSRLRMVKPAHPVLPPKDWSRAEPVDGGWRNGGQ